MTNEQTIKQINKDLEKIILNVTEWAEDLLKEYIIEYVYKWGESQKRYALLEYGQRTAYYIHNNKRPTYQLLHSITHEAHRPIADYVGYMIFADPDKMELDGKDALHGTRTHDYRAVILQRLNDACDDIPNNAHIRWWTKRKPFFDMYLEELDDSIHLKFMNEMHKFGWKPKHHGRVERTETYDFM